MRNCQSRGVDRRSETPGVAANRETYPIGGRLHIAGVVSGAWPDGSPIEYLHLCSHCSKLSKRDADRALRFLTSEYGLWFLRKSGDLWKSADPQGDGYTGYRPLETLKHYKNCLQGRSFSGRD